MGAFSFSVSGGIGGGGSPGGSSPQMQWNNGGAFDGTAALEYDNVTPALRGLNTLTGGYRVFNTPAVTGNTEFGSMYWASNTLRIGSDITGTGTRREVQVGTFNAGTGQSYIRMLASGSVIMQYLVPNSATVSQIGHYFNNAGAYTASSGTQTLTQMAFTVNQTGTAGYTLLDLAATETGTGSGAKKLLDCRVGGASRFTITNLGITQFTPSATQSLLAANAITVNRGMLKVQGSGGAVTLTSTPTIAAGVEGDVIFIVGQSNANTVTVQDRGTLASSNLRLGATTRTLGNGDVLALVYDGSLWSEMYYANNL